MNKTKNKFLPEVSERATCMELQLNRVARAYLTGNCSIS